MILLTILLACGSESSDNVTGETATKSDTEETTTVASPADSTTTSEVVNATNITTATSPKKEEISADDESLKDKTSE
jgi:hypothetical protein